MKVLRALDEQGITDDTLVIFVTDNGTSPKCQFDALADRGVDLRGNRRGHKTDIWEGGHRVPFLVRWPRAVNPGTRDETVSLMDAMATVAEVVGYPLPDDVSEDSVSLLPALRNEARDGPLHDGVITHSISGRFAIHSGPWKLALCPGSGGWSAPKDGKAREQGLPEVQLFDLTADPAEQRNLQAEHPAVVAALTARLHEIVTQGRSTPGAPQPNDGARWWAQLPWPE